ncbi:TIGR01440 family protein [Peribacillus acanthi]|uniref:TIGR01440 family protein n=1 Tax=Peribacillus acanthi TaxID=2171554 RepID=UPI000D3EA0B9|nr:TIGR01440 family protein [Peribacillus acanthi]
MDQTLLKGQLHKILNDFSESVAINDKKLLVIGCSTSEIAGERIGTAGTMEIADTIFSIFHEFHEKTRVQLAFQCCEHLNRALVLTSTTAQKYGYEEVSVVPVRNAGGALAATAFERLDDAVVVENIKADMGIDIGDTFIGMHLKPVAVPVRSSQKNIGHAHVTMAYSRPKLIGGTRAVYEKTKSNENCS